MRKPAFKNSKYYGVYFSKSDPFKAKKDKNKNWRVDVHHNKINYYLGWYSTEREAAICVDIWIIMNNVNKPLNILKKK